MSEKTKILKKFLVVPVGVVIFYLIYQCLYINGEAKDIKSIQDYSKISKSAYVLDDRNTLELINTANADDKITRKELRAIKQSSVEFKREIPVEIKPAEQREREFMERKAKYFDETQKTINNE